MAEKQVDRWFEKKVNENDTFTTGYSKWLKGESISTVTAVSGDTAKVTIGTAQASADIVQVPKDSGNPDGPQVSVPAGEASLVKYDVIGGKLLDEVLIDITITSSGGRTHIETVGIRIVG